MSLSGYCPLFYGTISERILRAERIIEIQGISKRFLTHSALRGMLYQENIIMPEIVLKQAILESGNFTSQLCKEQNNIFGMKYARQRKTMAIGRTPAGYAIYRSWQDAVKDYKYFQEFYQSRGRDLKDYYSFLRSIGYASDPRYEAKLKSIL
jgi:flagellum-specific peptidoglycan hydrolase FlgJ